MSKTPKSPALLAAERELAKLEASIAAENARRESEHRIRLEKLRMKNDALRAASKVHDVHPIAVHEASSIPPPTGIPHPHLSNLGASQTPMVLPPTGAKELPEPCLLLLREMWARLGYEGGQFVDMQMEISRELERADFSRFEREMLCNEVLMLRKEVNTLNTERTELIRRCNTANADLSQLVAAEEKTYQALIAERELAQQHLAEAEEAAHLASHDADKEAAKVAILNEEMARLEKERLIAIQHAKRMEEDVKRAEHEAFRAASRPPQKVAVPVKVPVVVPVSGRPVLAQAPSSLHSSHNLNTPIDGWSKADEEALKAKVAERRLAAEEARLAAEEKRLAQEKLRMQLQRERLATPGPRRGDDFRGEPMRNAFVSEGGKGTRPRTTSLGGTILGQTGSGDWGSDGWRDGAQLPGAWTDSGTSRGRAQSAWEKEDEAWTNNNRIHNGSITPGRRNMSAARW